MTQEDKLIVARIIRQETGCGLHDATVYFDKLLEAISARPPVIMDSYSELNFIWDNSTD